METATVKIPTGRSNAWKIHGLRNGLEPTSIVFQLSLKILLLFCMVVIARFIMRRRAYRRGLVEVAYRRVE